MKYYFDAWMFVRGSGSHCYTSRENVDLSASDQAGMAKAYPHAQSEREQVIRERESAISLLQSSPAIQQNARLHLDRVKALK